MSTTIDSRVVQMTFDNEQFEQKAEKSLGTLDKLTKALKFEKSADGLKRLENSANELNFGGFEGSVVKVQNQFSVLQSIAFSALQNITNSAINAGKSMVNALTLDPVTTGFEEYETQINAVQTILSNTRSKGTTIDDVNRALDELNHYADKTIYNFTEMTRNIGTFTAAGIGLNEATKSIQGIANLAAVSGSSSQQASVAMYQLSQALAAGRVSLQDWNSVVNAGMGGEVFQKALIRTAKVMGTGVDEAIEKYGTFRESLTQGKWLTTEVLTETLNQLANSYTKGELLAKGYSESQAKEILALGQDAEDAATKVKTLTQLWDTLTEAAQSGWTNSWEQIMGDFYEARDLLTNISDSVSDIINTQSDMRNELLRQAIGKHAITDKEWNQFIGGGLNSGKAMKTIKTVAAEYGMSVDKMKEDAGSFKASLATGWFDRTMLRNTLKYSNGLKEVAKSTEEGTKNSQKLAKAVNASLGGEVKSGTELLKDLNNNGIETSAVLANLSAKLDNAGMSLAYFSDDGLKESYKWYDAQIQNFHNLLDAIEEVDDPLAKMLLDLEKPTGRAMVIESATNILKVMGSVVSQVGKAWHDVFGTIDAYGLYEAIRNFRDMTAQMKLSDKTAKTIRVTFSGLFTILKAFAGILRIGITIASKIIVVAAKVASILIRVTASFVSFLTNIYEAAARTVEFNGAINAVRTKIEEFREVIGNLVNNLGELKKSFGDIPGVKVLGDAFDSLKSSVASFAVDKIVAIAGAFGSFLGSIKMEAPKLETLKGLLDNAALGMGNFIKSFVNGDENGETPIKKFASKIGSESDLLNSSRAKFDTARDKLGASFGKLKSIFDKLASQFSFERFINLLKTGSLLLFVSKVTSVIDSVNQLVKGGKGVTDKLKGVLNETSKTLKAYQTQIKADALMSIAKAIAIIAGSLFALSFVPSDKLANVVVDLGFLLLIVAVVMKVAQGFSKASDTLKEGAEGFKEQITEIIDGFKDAVTKSVKVAAFGAFAIMLSVAVAILAKTIASLVKIPFGKALASLIPITGMVAIIVAAASVLNKHAKDLNVGMGVALLGLGASIMMIANAAQILGNMNFGSLLQGMVSVIAIMGMMSLLAKISENAHMVSLAAGMILLSVGLLTLIPALLAYSAVPWDTFLKGAGMLTILGLGMAVVARVAGQSIAGAAGIILIAGALALLTPQLLLVGATWQTALVGLGLLAGGLLALVVAGGLASTVAVGLMALTGVITSIGGAALSVGAGFALFGLGMNLVASGVKTLGSALPLLATGVVAMAKTLVSNAGTIHQAAMVLIGGVALGIAASKSKIALAVVGVLIGVMDVIIQYGPAIKERIKIIGSGVMDAIGEFLMSLPNLVITGLQSIVGLIPGVMDAIGELLMSFRNLVITGLQSIVGLIPGVGDKLSNALEKFKVPMNEVFKKEEGKEQTQEWGEGIYQGVADLPDKLGTVGSEGITSFTDNLSNFDISGITNIKSSILGELDDLPDKAGEIAKKTSSNLSNMGGTAKVDTSGATKSLKSLDSNFKSTSKEASSASKGVNSSLSSITKSFGTVTKTAPKQGKEAGTGFGDSLAKGITAKSGTVKASATKVAAQGAAGARSQYHSFHSAGSYSMAGLVSGFNSKMGDVRSSAIRAANLWNSTYRAHQKIKSPSRVQFKNGQFTLQGLINGIEAMFPVLTKTGRTASNMINKTLSKPIDAVMDVLNSEVDMNPVITPVLSLGSMRQGLATLDSSLQARTLQISANTIGAVGNLAASGAIFQNRNNNEIASAITSLKSDLSRMQGDSYNINGITYDDGSNIASAVGSIVRALRIEGRM